MTVRIVSMCTACGACLTTCPEGALSPGRGRPSVDDAACTDCMACIEICPAGAISVLNPLEEVGHGAVAPGGEGL